jgi:oligopeptide/dipeptide ABC transporter ATP-binding protein
MTNNNNNNNNNKILEVKNFFLSLHTENGDLPVLQNVNFHINKGEFLALVGESGCGKSVCAMALTKLLPNKLSIYKSGEILFERKNILAMESADIHQIRGKRISYIFQEPFSSLNPLHKIKDQIIESFMIHGLGSKKEAIEKAEFLLSKVGITDIKERMNSYPNEMSGGMLQRICIAMALITDPVLLIADEPTSAIDVTIQVQLIQLLLELKREFSLSLLFISHDIALVSHIADRLAVMYAGSIVESGLVDSIVDSPKHPYTQALLKAYPSLRSNSEELVPIDGMVPSPMDYPKGCHFAERCKNKMDICLNSKPELSKITDSHEVYCYLYGNKQ